MGIDIVFRIAGIGILVAVACQLREANGTRRHCNADRTCRACDCFDDGYRSYCNAFRKCSKCV